MNSQHEVLTGADFQRMIASAYQAFLREHEYINSLNVFPVPDGDTGTNMLLTISAINQAMVESDISGIGQLSRLAADSAIMGARGNSGVILAQLFRGIGRGLAGKETASAAELGKSFQYGILYAYRAVARPVEGTILTVAKGIAKGARHAVRGRQGFADILAEAIRVGEIELARTPELLPILKVAGVVDAGGQGLLVLLAGCLEGLTGVYRGPEAGYEQSRVATDQHLEQNLAHPYCTEFLVVHPSLKVGECKSQLELLGESLVLAEAKEVIKVHIHTAHPGKVLETALAWGTLRDIKIENMADQHRPVVLPVQKAVELAVISVSPGPGFSELMRRMGATVIIDGGQTMNPPVEEFVNAVHGGQAKRYIILPNNSNIILAAVQAQKLLGDTVEVIATKSVPEGLAALLAFNPEDDLKNNVKQMQNCGGKVVSAGITQAVRDSFIDERPFPAGYYIGVADGQVLAAEEKLETTLSNLINKLITADSELLSLYYGAELDRQVADRLVAAIIAEFGGLEVQLYYGGQPHYQFLLGVE